MRLLVGHDGSDGGRDALELARVLGSEEGASALVVTVIPYGPLPTRFQRLERDAAAEAAPILAQAGERLDAIPFETRAFGGGSPAGVITELAEGEEIDLIVMGSPHRRAIGRALIGSVAKGILHGAPCAVAIAPHGYAQRRHDRLGLIAAAYDGTPESKHALERARALAETHGALVRVLTVVAPPAALPGVVGYTPIEPPEPAAVVEEGVRAVGTSVRVEGRRLDGHPAYRLARACEEGVDLLVAGSRGYGPAMRVMLGSVSSRLITEAPCPVLVVPRPREG